MHDLRISRLAEILVDHSCQVAAGEKVLIEAFDLPTPALVCRLVELINERGAYALVSCKSNAILRTLYLHGAEAGIALAGELEQARMQRMDAYIGIRGAANSSQQPNTASNSRAGNSKLATGYWQQKQLQPAAAKQQTEIKTMPNKQISQQH